MIIDLNSFVVGSYVTGVFFMFFFGHLITVDRHVETRIFGGML